MECIARMKRIVVVGCGYVGLSISVLLAQNHMVTVVDKDPDKVEKINAGISTIKDDYIESYLSSQPLYLSATLNGKTVYKDADYVVIATPTNYDSELGHFDCSSVESVVEEVFSVSDEAVIVIKSTIPVGYTEELRQKFETNRILFSPEFLRESKALYDNLYPNRLIISCDQESMHWAKEFLQFLKDASLKPDVPMLLADFSEAEAIKLFANTYLALRVAFFNELDTYAEVNSLDTTKLIAGISFDPRIGNFYNNPSFGYGGYCLPKDTKQLLANYDDIPQNLISAIIESNDTRKRFILKQILKKAEKYAKDKPEKYHNKNIVVGVHRLVMKSGGDNFRLSAVLDILDGLKKSGIDVIVYEPLLGNDTTYTIIDDIERFKEDSDIIIANRYDPILGDVINKVYTRDCFGRD